MLVENSRRKKRFKVSYYNLGGSSGIDLFHYEEALILGERKFKTINVETIAI